MAKCNQERKRDTKVKYNLESKKDTKENRKDTKAMKERKKRKNSAK